MATIGTSVAASGYIITSSGQVKRGSMSLSDLSASVRKALRGAPGPSGPPGIDGEDGVDGSPGDPGENGDPATNLWAQIGANGDVNASSAGVTAITSSAGVYDVNFGADITHCAALAVQGALPDFGAAGLASAGVPGPAFVSVRSAGSALAAGFPSLSSVEVQTGRTSGALVSASFTLAVLC
jgi:hypothetical protein